MFELGKDVNIKKLKIGEYIDELDEKYNIVIKIETGQRIGGTLYTHDKVTSPIRTLFIMGKLVTDEGFELCSGHDLYREIKHNQDVYPKINETIDEEDFNELVRIWERYNKNFEVLDCIHERKGEKCPYKEGTTPVYLEPLPQEVIDFVDYFMQKYEQSDEDKYIDFGEFRNKLSRECAKILQNIINYNC